MKIGPANLQLVSPATGQTEAAPGARPASSAAAPGGASAPGATVELSEVAASLRAEGMTPEFDADKVARISQAIAEGNFQVNPGVIADKLIANARELLDRTGSN